MTPEGREADVSAGSRRLRRRLSRACRGVAFGEVEDLDEGGRWLGAGDGVFAVHDEAGHAVDPEAAGVDVGGDDFLAAFVAREEVAGTILLDAGANGAFDQRVEIADIEALLEIGLEQLRPRPRPAARSWHSSSTSRCDSTVLGVRLMRENWNSMPASRPLSAMA